METRETKVVYDLKNREATVYIDVDENEKPLVPPLALDSHGSWTVHWEVPDGWEFDHQGVTFANRDWPPSLIGIDSRRSDHDRRWIATLSNKVKDANYGKYTICIQRSGQGQPIHHDPTIVVTKDPIPDCY